MSSDNFRLRVTRPQKAGQPTTLLQALQKLASPATWEDAEFQQRFLQAVPEYRLSKLQPALPPHRFLTGVQAYLLDAPQALHNLNERRNL